ncbi:DUF4238 domain-containing protein [Ferrovibrio terrae]|uniref:DUF4238 domain-containing protein n=1 Tax=Ferrovibrio terrae TaxID=2594003 RepID=UPI003137A975
MSTPRRHHFVPAFYLQQWAGPTGDVIEHSVKHINLVSKPIGPASTGFEFDLYAFDALPPETRQHLEQRFFNYVDGLASSALGQLLDGRYATVSDPKIRSAWSRFVLAMITRHPDTMAELRNGAERIWREAGQGYLQQDYEKFRRPEDPPTLEEYHAKADPLIEEKMKLNLLISVFDHAELGQRVNNMHWAVLDLSKAKHRLLTSDRPVQYWDLNKPTGVLSIPISPTKMFLAVNDRKILKQVLQRPSNEFVVGSNKNVVTRARRYVWSHDMSQFSFIKRYISTALEKLPLFPSMGGENTKRSL